MTIRARQVIDGRGGAISNAHVSIKNGKIVSVGPASGAPTVDLGNLTLLPGFIDTHVHIGWHFDDKGRYHSGPEPADQAALYGAENAYVTLINGFTTVQSVGVGFRQAAARCDQPRRAAGTAHPVVARPDFEFEMDARSDSRTDPQAEGRRRRPDQDLRVGQHPRRRRADAVAGASRCGVR